MNIVRTMILVALNIGLVFLAVYIIKRSLRETFKAIREAMKSEVTSDTGRINLVAGIVIAVMIFVFNLHDMIGNALSVDQPRTENHVIAPAALLILFFMGSLICVVVLEMRNK